MFGLKGTKNKVIQEDAVSRDNKGELLVLWCRWRGTIIIFRVTEWAAGVGVASGRVLIGTLAKPGHHRGGPKIN